jgi:hypothetical protein
MAKAAKSKKVGKNKVKRRIRKTGTSRMPVNHPYNTYARLLQDPCDGPTDLAARYRGEAGFVQRFVSDGTMNIGTGHTAGYVLFHPNSGSVVTVSGPGGSTTAVISLSTYALAAASLPGPGAAYLTGAADKLRAYAACVQAYPSAVSITNMTGEFACGVISMSSTFGTWSADSFFTMLAGRGIINKSRVEVKWYPGSLDDRYSQFNVNTTLDPSDTNVIVLAYRGYPASAALSIRLTTVVEWTPKVAIGVAPTQTTSPTLPHDDIIHAIHSKRPGWLHNLSESVGHATGNFVGGVAQDLAKAGRYAAQKGLAKGLSKLESAMFDGALMLL